MRLSREPALDVLGHTPSLSLVVYALDWVGTAPVPGEHEREPRRAPRTSGDNATGRAARHLVLSLAEHLEGRLDPHNAELARSPG